MRHPSEYPPEQLNDQSNGLLAVAPIVPTMIEELGTSLVPQEVHPPQEALFGDRCIFIHAEYGPGAMYMDREARH